MPLSLEFDWRQKISKETITLSPFISSDICDYEVRRSLVWESVKKNSFQSLENLDELRKVIDFLQLETEVMFNASQIWMETRPRGKKTAEEFAEALNWEDIRLSYFAPQVYHAPTHEW